MANLAGVVQQLRKERVRVTKEVERLDAALAALNGAGPGRRIGTRRGLSAAGRARIGAAQRARWAKVKSRYGSKNTASTIPTERRMSAAGRRRIAAAQRARWAKLKAKQKKAA